MLEWAKKEYMQDIHESLKAVVSNYLHEATQLPHPLASTLPSMMIFFLIHIQEMT